MKSKVISALCFFTLLAAISGFGQVSAINVKIDFPFTVAGKDLPAGPYSVARDSSALAFRVSGEGKNAAIAEILTRLTAELHATRQEAHLVFDKVGETYILSEIWIPGQDGYMVALTKGPHQHKVVSVKY
jgi:hypothetical protein